MRAQIIGWIGSAVGAIATTGRPALLAAAGIAVLVLAVICWVIIDHDRTANLVAILSSLRGRARGPEAGLEGDVSD